MKMKNLSALLFALVFMFISTVPSYAIEGEVLPDPEQEETAPIQPPEDEPEPEEPPEDEPEPEEPLEDEPEPEEPPALPDDPVEPGDETPEDPEDPEGPPNGDYAEGPDDEEPSDEDDFDEGSSDEDNPDSIPGEDEESEENEVGEEEEDDLFINVLVPASGQVIINPYHMIVCTSTGETTDQIIHEPQMLESFTEYPLQVSARVVGTFQPWSAAQFVFEPPADDALDKEFFMYVEFQSDPTQWSYTYGDWFNQILVMDWWEGKENVMTLDACGVGYFRLFGAMTPYPADMWAEDDVMTVTLAFTFTPADENTSFTGETSGESFDTMFIDSSDADFDDMQVVTPEPIPDTISEPAPDQNPELTAEETLEPELDAADILDPFESIAPVLDSEQKVDYQLNEE